MVSSGEGKGVQRGFSGVSVLVNAEWWVKELILTGNESFTQALVQILHSKTYFKGNMGKLNSYFS